MKKLRAALAALLALATVLSLAGCGGQNQAESTAEVTETSAEAGTTEAAETEQTTVTETEPEPEKPTKEQLVEAIRQSAMSYYYKNPYCQYESEKLTAEGFRRQTWEKSAEYAAADQYHYSVCSSFVSGVYYDAFGYLLGTETKTAGSIGMYYSTDKFQKLEGPAVVYRKENNTEADLAQAGKEIRALLEPGDVVVSAASGSGHEMLYLGDVLGDGKDYLIHCWGAHIKDGVDSVETDGSIYLQTADELIFDKPASGKPSWSVMETRRSETFVCVYRPFLAEDFTWEITEATKSRMTYPDIVISREADRSSYDTVMKGEKLTLTMTVENRSKTDYPELQVREAAAEGAKLVSGKTEETLTLKAGEKKTLSFTYEVTAEPGSLVHFPETLVADIPARGVSIKVGYEKLSDSQVKGFTVLAKKIAAGEVQAGKELKAVSTVYEMITGKTLGLPDTVSDYLTACFGLKMVGEDRFLQLKEATDSNRALLQMQAYKLFGGTNRRVEGSLYDRTMEIVENRFQPGDILVVMRRSDTVSVVTDSDLAVYLYLGEQNVLALEGTKAPAVVSFTQATKDLLAAKQFFTLRPSLVIDGLQQEDHSAELGDAPEPQEAALTEEQKAALAALSCDASTGGNMSYVTGLYKAAGIDISAVINGTTYGNTLQKYIFKLKDGKYVLRDTPAEGFEKLMASLYHEYYGGRMIEQHQLPTLADLDVGDMVCVGIVDGEQKAMNYTILMYQGEGRFAVGVTYREVPNGDLFRKQEVMNFTEESFRAYITDEKWTGYFVMRPILGL